MTKRNRRGQSRKRSGITKKVLAPDFTTLPAMDRNDFLDAWMVVSKAAELSEPEGAEVSLFAYLEKTSGAARSSSQSRPESGAIRAASRYYGARKDEYRNFVWRRYALLRIIETPPLRPFLRHRTAKGSFDVHESVFFAAAELPLNATGHFSIDEFEEYAEAICREAGDWPPNALDLELSTGDG